MITCVGERNEIFFRLLGSGITAILYLAGMKKFITVAILFISLSAHSQITIDLKDISKHIGDSVQLNGVIFGGKCLETVKGLPTFLNVGAEYPNAPLTLVMWGTGIREQFWKQTPETSLKGKDCLIFGKLELYKDKPQIVIHSSNQIIEPTKVHVK
jgi:hypothetical protein